MRLFDERGNYNGHYQDFCWIDKKHFGRQIGQKNGISIYDDYLRVSGWRYRMIMTSGKEKIQLFKWGAFIFHFGDPRPLLLKFINRRYEAHFRKKDFKNQQEMIYYIL